jgi:PPOX class probable F420-dependent enzyme
MSRRAEIRMSEAELHAFLAEEYVVTCASLGPGGRPHLMPLWYVPDGAELTSWTYGASQKVKNLERRPEATVQVEAGQRYDELRGVMMECDVEIIRDPQRVLALGLRLAERYLPVHGLSAPLTAAARGRVEKQAPKRVGLRFRPTRIVSWDHRKLGAPY